MFDENNPEMKTLLEELINRLAEDEIKIKINSNAVESVKVIKAAAEVATKATIPETLSSLDKDDSSFFASLLSLSIRKILEFYLSTLKKLPPEMLPEIVNELNVIKQELQTDLDSISSDIKQLSEDIEDKLNEKLETQQDLEKRMIEIDKLCKDTKILEDTLNLYAKTSRRIFNNLPRSLEKSESKLKTIEKLLEEVDEEMRSLIEEHQRNSNVIKIISN